MEIKNVKATLSFGEYFSGIKIILVYIFIALSLILPIISIIIYFISVYGQIDLEIQIIITLLLGNVISIFLFLILIFIVLKNHKHKLYIQNCFKDAFLIKVNVSSYQIMNSYIKPNRVLVNFSYQNTEYNLINKNGNVIFGYSKIFKKYLGKEIEVLFSISNKEILFLNHK